MSDTSLTITIPEDLAVRISQEAKNKGLPISDYVKLALWNYLGGLAQS